MDKIVLPQIRIIAAHGVNKQEQEEPQPFTIAVTLYLDLSQAAKSDDLADTVDYGELYEKIAEHAAAGHYHLIEALAGSIADIVLAAPQVEGCKVAVTKEEAKTLSSVFPATVVIKRGCLGQG